MSIIGSLVASGVACTHSRDRQGNPLRCGKKILELTQSGGLFIKEKLSFLLFNIRSTPTPLFPSIHMAITCHLCK